MNIYYVVVLGIIAVAIGVPAYRYPNRSSLFQLGVGCIVAAVLGILVVLTTTLYLIASGQT